MENFNELNLDQRILEALEAIGINKPTEIQEKAIPVMLQGVDLIGQAQTGTGKTFAYGIPLINNLKFSNDVEALVLCPTRELSIQVAEELKKLLKYFNNAKIATIYGGESYEKQIRQLKAHPQIVVGTPGRIIDHMNKHTLHFDKLHTLVLDEADEMLKMCFQENLETILAQTPENRQTALFSATMPDFIKMVAKKYQQDPTHIIIKKKTLTVDRIDQKLYYCKRESKTDLLIRLLDLYDFSNVIVFVNTKSKVDDITI
jgi:ATP-dependent RNA helicase DeaD